MKHYYVSSLHGASGIAKYSADFFSLVLAPMGYRFIDSNQDLSRILTEITSSDHIHIEVGIFQKKEQRILEAMLNAGYKNVSVTLHDAPLIKYPQKVFQDKLLNNLSKFYDIYVKKQKTSKETARKLRNIYVLSKTGIAASRKLFMTDNIHFIPHVVDPAEIEMQEGSASDLLYFGFIGKNKGVEYTLKLHQRLLSERADLNLYVIGTMLGNQQYLEKLKEKYQQNVHFLGFVEEAELPAIFKKAALSILPFKQYKHYAPVSGSALYSMKKGKVVFTTSTNALPDIIQTGKNGYFLSGNLDQDKDMVISLLNDPNKVRAIQDYTRNYLLQYHHPAVVRQYLKS